MSLNVQMTTDEFSKQGINVQEYVHPILGVLAITVA